MTTVSLSSISEDIIVLIADHVVAMNEDTLEGWKNSLMLLSINNAWRVALLPIIYRRLYSVYHETNTQKTKSDGEHENILMSLSLKTNLNLIAELGYANLSRRFHVKIEDKTPINGLNSIIAEMEKYACDWSHVKSIHTWIKCNNKNETEDPSNIEVQNIEAGNVVDALFKLMPKIVKLNLGQAVENRVTKIIFERLAESYAGQATRLVCNHPLLISKSCYFSGLVYLKIKMESRLNHQIPVVCAESLQYLSIDNLPINNMWPSINENDKIQSFEFLNLHSLHISFIGHRPSALEDEGHTQSKTTSMIFPKLSCLSVQNIDGFYALIDRAVFPKRISKLKLTGKLEDFGLLNKKMLPTVSRLLLTMVSVDGNNNDMFDTIENLAWKGQEHTALEIFATGGVEFDLPKNLLCTNITKLVLSRPTSANTTLEIIRVMPQLVDLKLFRLVTRDLPSTFSIQSYTEHEEKRLQPFDTRIKAIVLSYRLNESPLHKNVAFIIHLLARIPSLEEFCNIKAPPELITRFTSKIETLYPHLSNIKYMAKPY